MQITVDTKHDSHDDIRKVIAMLRHLVGEQDIFTNASPAPASQQQSAETFSNLFSDAENPQLSKGFPASPEVVQPSEKKADDLFSDLLSEDDLPEAKQQPDEEEEDESSSRKPKIEFY